MQDATDCVVADPVSPAPCIPHFRAEIRPSPIPSAAGREDGGVGKGMEPVSTYPDGGGRGSSWSRRWGQALSPQFYRVARPPQGSGCVLSA